MKSITVVSDDKVGLLAEISYVLAKSNVNIEHMDFEVIGKKAIVSLSVADEEVAKNSLNKAGYEVGEDNCLFIKLVDKPGEFNRLAGMLSHEGINIEKVHMISREGKRTILSLVVDRPDPASKLLHQYLTTSDI
jgi:hypothetical protein